MQTVFLCNIFTKLTQLSILSCCRVKHVNSCNLFWPKVRKAMQIVTNNGKTLLLTQFS